MVITQNKLKGLEPRDRLYRVSCGDGLLLEVTPTGSKLWRFRYRRNGGESMLALGRFPKVTLKRARALRDEQVELLDAGEDPAEQRRIETAKAAGEHTFKHLATEFLDARAKSTRTAAEDSRSRFVRWVYPSLGSRDIGEIGFKDVRAVLKRIEKAGLNETARRVRADISRVYRYAMANGMVQSDPTPVKEALLDYQPTPFPNPPPDKVPGILRAIDGCESVVVRSALQLMPLLMCRPGELQSLRWDEIHDDEIRLSASRTKQQRDHIIPLSKQAKAILDELREVTDYSPYVFPSVRSAERSMSNATMGAALRRLGFTSSELVPHSFRKISSTTLHEMGYDSLWVEAQLGHVDSNKIRAKYNAAEYLSQRREMLQAWADKLDELKAKKP